MEKHSTMLNGEIIIHRGKDFWGSCNVMAVLLFCIACVHLFTQKLFFTIFTYPAWHKVYGVGIQRQLKQRSGSWTCCLLCKWKMMIFSNVNVWSLCPHFCDVNQCNTQSQRDLTVLSLFIQIITFRTLIWEEFSLPMQYPVFLLTCWDPVNLSLEWYSWFSGHRPAEQ